jgi:RNA polymerase sigma factor (sigma-70 family)
MNQGHHHPRGAVADLDLAEQSEEQLIDRGLKGDARALDILFARNTRALYQTAFRVLGNPEDAEEALQEGLLSAYRNLPRFERRSQFSTWLTRIVINAALMRRRSKRSRPAVSLDDFTSEGELPLAERFADESPIPSRFTPGPSSESAWARNLRRSPRFCGPHFGCAKSKGSPPRKRHTRWVFRGTH